MELGHGFEEAFMYSLSVADDDSPTERLTVESIAHLHDGISFILSEFITLRKAVASDLQIGGSPRKEFINNTAVRLKTQKVDEIHSEIFNWFTQSKVALKTRALKRLIYQAIRRYYKLSLFDGSPYQIARKLMDLHQECLHKSVSRMEVEEASLKDRRIGQGRRAHGARHTPY